MWWIQKCALSLAIVVCAAQEPSAGQITAPPAFDVVSIKLRKDAVNFIQGPYIKSRTVIGTGNTVRDFVTYAYDVRYDRLMAAPDWAASEHYDLEAKSSGESKLTLDQARQMMRTLLAQRFQLKVHPETRDEAVYLLKTAKGGPKMKPVAPDATGGMVVRGTDKGVLRVEAGKATMERLTTQLSFTSSRRVLDQTGLAGFFAFTFDYFPDNRQMPPDLDAPAMFEALRQLGLQIEQGRAPIERLYIDHVERPAEN